MHLRLCTLALLGSSSFAACAHDEQKLSVPAPDAALFQQSVYPVLLRDCGFPACHGDQARFFQVFGPGRTRLDDGSDPGIYDPPSIAELERTYERARSMLAYEDSPGDALLLSKPLSVSEGGAGHKGLDAWGNDVYRTKSASGYQTLRAWARQAFVGAP